MDLLLAVQGKVLERGVVRGQAVIRWYLGMSRQVIIQREVLTRVRWLAGWMSGVGSICSIETRKKPTAHHSLPGP